MELALDVSPLSLDARANPFQPRAVQRSVSLPFVLSPHSSSTLETPHRLIASEEDIPHVDPRNITIPVQYCPPRVSPGSERDVGHNVVVTQLHLVLPLTTDTGPTSR